MQLHFRIGTFWLTTAYEEREAARAAGFLWHGGGCVIGCAACRAGLHRVWWTSLHAAARRLQSVADEAARGELEQHTASLAASRAAGVEIVDFDRIAPCPGGLAYLPYQKAAIIYALARRNCLLGDEQGCGKSVEAVGYVNATPQAEHLLIVCPASMKVNWLRELTRWLVRRFVIRVLSGKPDAQLLASLVAERQAVGAVGDALIINYDILAQWADVLDKQRYDVLILDEAHFCKNADALRTRTVLGTYDRRGQLIGRGLIHHAEHLLFLTGTAISNRPSELFPLLRALDHEGLGANYARFHFRYCNPQRVLRGRRTVWDFSGASRLDELQELLRSTCMVRRLKRDVLLELPPKRHQVIELATNGAAAVVRKEQEAYAQHEETIRQLELSVEVAENLGDDTAYRDTLAQLTEARRHAFEDIARVRHEVGLAKVPYVLEHARTFLEASSSKVIVFGWHRDVIEKLKAGLADFGVVAITGDTSMDERQRAIDAFQTDTATRVFVGNIRAAGTGITLTAADTVMFAELSFVPSDIQQASDRAHRIGQTQAVLVQFLVFDGSLDAKMAKTMAGKMAMIERALDVPASPITEAEISPLTRAAQERPTRQYPVYGAAAREVAQRIVARLAGSCDRAVTRDGAGFSKLDQRFGHALAQRAQERPLTDGEVDAIRKLTDKYRRQLDPQDVAFWSTT